MNQDYLRHHLGLEIKGGEPIYKSDSKLILAGKSHRLGDMPVALKFSSIKADIIDTYVTNFRCVSKLKSHPGIIKHHEIFKIETSAIEYSVVEVLELVQSVQHPEAFKAGLSSKQLKRMIIRLLEGFSFLHANHLLHRDIKPDNLLIYREKGNYYFKIIDLDFIGGAASQTLVTTPEFLAPEVNSYLDYDVKAEIWAIGLVLYLIFVGKMPFQTRKQKLSIEEIKNEVMSCQFDFSLLPMPLRIPVSLCMKKNPKERIGSLGELMFIIDPVFFLKSKLQSLFR
ncbi:protein kinase domain-containing protein [Algoriphagus namhaensis]